MPKHNQGKDKFAGFAIPVHKKVETDLLTDERDERFKRLYTLLWITWQERHGKGNISYAIDKAVFTQESVDLAHIKGKKAHPELRYSFDNVQLITRQAHMLEHQTGKSIDYRPKDFIAWLENYDYNK